jgi:hypothetical protein
MQKQNKKIIFILGTCFVILFLIFGFYYLNNNSNNKEESLEEKYKKVEETLSSYQKKLEADNYGGKTPQETLNLFIQALEKEDIEEASKYFWIDMKNSKDVWKNALLKAKEEKKLMDIVSLLKKAQYEEGSSSQDVAWFSVKNKDGLAEYSIVLKLNRNTGVWKIEEM